MMLKLYGFLVSQPTRSVAWVCKVKGLAYEFVKVHPRNGDANTNAFRAMNPNGLVPVVQDGDFTLFEGAAILTYLSEKHSWTDMLPADLHQRAKVYQYLHWHHTNARKATKEILVSYIAKASGHATATQLEFIDKKETIISHFTGILEKMVAGPCIVGTQQPTVADFMCYCELGQLETMGVFDFSKYPKVHAWLQHMKTIPFHDEVHEEFNGFIESLQLKPASLDA